MKISMVLAVLAFSLNTFAYTITAKDNERYKSQSVDIYISNTFCKDIGMTPQKLENYLISSLKRYWGSVKAMEASPFRWHYRGIKKISYMKDTNLNKGLNKVKQGEVVIACNKSHYQFPGNPGLGMQAKFKCSSSDCKGLIYINANADSMVKDYSEQQMVGYLGYSLGKSIGIGGSRQMKALMYYYIFRPYPQELHSDDMAALKFLYPY